MPNDRTFHVSVDNQTLCFLLELAEKGTQHEIAAVSNRQDGASSTEPHTYACSALDREMVSALESVQTRLTNLKQVVVNMDSRLNSGRGNDEAPETDLAVVADRLGMIQRLHAVADHIRRAANVEFQLGQHALAQIRQSESARQSEGAQHSEA